MRTWETVRRLLLVPFRFPGILAVSMAYSGLLYATSLHASFLDIRNPYWVLSVGALLLSSPIYHTVVVPMIDAVSGDRSSEPVKWRIVIEHAYGAFPWLLLGEIAVAAAVATGSLLLVLPGIYIGMRLVFYKQAIILEQRVLSDALRRSLQLTQRRGAMGRLFVGLSVLHGCAIGLDLLLASVASNAVIHVGAVIGTGLLLAWINTLVTASYAPLAGDGENQAPAGERPIG